MGKSKTTKKSIEKSKSSSWLKKNITHPKLVVFLFVLLLIPVIATAYNYYQDWDNAQMIKGIAEDFPALVKDIEQETGLDLEINKDCMTTTEKFSAGVKTCELSVFLIGDTEKNEEAYKVLRQSRQFTYYSDYDNKEGFNAAYRKKKSCQFRTKNTIYISCVIGVRNANEDLAKEVFSRNLNE